MTDPTNTIDTYDRAQVLAHAMLRLAPDPSPSFWQDISEPLLAALLYAASPAMGGSGIGWVQDTVVATIAGGTFAAAPGAPQVQAEQALSIMSERQRQRALLVLHSAVTPWVQTGVGAHVA